MKWVIIILMAFFYTACGPEETPEPNPENDLPESENDDDDVEPNVETTTVQSEINPNVLICVKEDQTLTFELKQYEVGSTDCNLEASPCSTACGCELTLTEGDSSRILLCSNSADSDHCSQGFEQVKQGLSITGNTSSTFHNSYGEMDCQPGTIELEIATDE